MVISYLTLNIISIKTVLSIAVSLTLGDYCFLYTIYHIQPYILPLPFNPIKIGIFIPIYHTVLCGAMCVMCWVYYLHNITMTLIYCAIILCVFLYLSFIFVHGLFVLILC